MGGYGRIRVYRDKQNILFHKASWEKISVKSVPHESKTSLVMYSLGMRGSWCEKTFCSPISQMRVCLGGRRETELEMT